MRLLSCWQESVLEVLSRLYLALVLIAVGIAVCRLRPGKLPVKVGFWFLIPSLMTRRFILTRLCSANIGANINVPCNMPLSVLHTVLFVGSVDLVHHLLTMCAISLVPEAHRDGRTHCHILWFVSRFTRYLSSC